MMSVTKLLASVALAIVGCSNGSFQDCAVACTAASGCPDGLTCGAEGLCRTATGALACAEVLPFPDASIDARPDGPPPGPVTFVVTTTAQMYTVPGGVTRIRVVAKGASGGDGPKVAGGTVFEGGFGGIVDTIVPVVPGDQLTVIVGEYPGVAPVGTDGCGASGGGGSFVVGPGSVALVVAGGGGGASAYYSLDGGDARTTTSGGNSGTVLGGMNGMGGGGATGEGGGGGGLTTAGGSGDGLGGASFAAGARGGERDAAESCGTTPRGGFGGGGGGGNDTGGGGGGYSGGAARSSGTGTHISGGGGSFGVNSPAIMIRTDHGHGSVVITPQ